MLTRRSMMAAGAAAPTLAAGFAAWAQADPAALADQARRETAALAARTAKAAAGMLILDGEPVWTETFGETGGPASRPVDPDTIFSLQSTSKNFCATAVMMAVQRGLVDLDAPLTTYLPDFVVSSRHEPEPQRRMTLRLLLSHRAGFTHDAPVGSNWDFPGPEVPFQAHIDSIQRTWLRHPVDERYAYSNLGIDLAGHALERVTGLPYPEVLRRWIFEPLGMRRTTADPDVYEADRNRAVGRVPGVEATLPVRIPIIPSGGVYSCISDMARYARFHLRRGAGERRRLLTPALWAQMHDFRYPADYALGVARSTLRTTGGVLPLYTHNGGGFGFGCCFYYAPALRAAWIVLFNNPLASFDGVFVNLLTARHGPASPPPPNPNPVVRLAPEALQARVGLYMNREARCRVSIEDGTLTLKFETPWGTNRLEFVGEDEGFIVEGPRRGAGVRFHPAHGLMAASFEYPRGDFWDFIDGPSVTAGPVGSEYDDRLGEYELRQMGRRVGKATLSRKNGWLYYDDIRLAPYAPGLLFSGAGEAMDLRGPIPTARNIPLHRI